MKEHAAERIVDLKSRGFENAGLYDTAGVGGTHVMYVLHHADTPQIYAGLPKDPAISLFFFNYTAPTEIYTLSLHDALPIYRASRFLTNSNPDSFFKEMSMSATSGRAARSEEHTSELQSHRELVCRLLL